MGIACSVTSLLSCGAVEIEVEIVEASCGVVEGKSASCCEGVTRCVSLLLDPHLRHTERMTMHMSLVTCHACTRQNVCSHLQRIAARRPQSRFPPHSS